MPFIISISNPNSQVRLRDDSGYFFKTLGASEPEFEISNKDYSLAVKNLRIMESADQIIIEQKKEKGKKDIEVIPKGEEVSMESDSNNLPADSGGEEPTDKSIVTKKKRKRKILKKKG